MLVTLRNDFHNQEIRLRTQDGHLTSRQLARARRALCGQHDCTCSGVSGMRGPQSIPHDIYEAILNSEWT